MKTFLVSTFARRFLAAIIIAAGAWVLAMGVVAVPVLKDGVHLANNVFYDAFYRQRAIEDQTAGDVMIIAVDDASLAAVDKASKVGWPWPRQYWGLIGKYLSDCGAKAVVIDLVFSQTSVYPDDDSLYADLVKDVKIPIVYGSLVEEGRNWQTFALPVKDPIFGAVNVGNDKVYREYLPSVFGKPSLAVAALRAAGEPINLPAEEQFRLHYFGPYANKEHHHTFRYISAFDVIAAAFPGAPPRSKAAAPEELFRGKIVFIGGTSIGLYDLKSTPLSAEYPGVEVQATALEDLMHGREVVAVSSLSLCAVAFLAALLSSFLIVFPRKAILKTLGPLLAVGIVLVLGAWLFTRVDIRWLAPVNPLLAVGFASVGGFTWTYFAEDRQRRFMLKALSKVVSPAIAEQLAREPRRLALGAVRTQITLLFTDLADFTSVTESMDVQKVGEFLNRYLGEMSDQVLLNQGTLDKYIGDAIMCFWNAPLPQEDHAGAACRAALAIVRREAAIREELKGMGASKVFTRIGINTTDAAVGFVGSSHLFNYTALGDGVNLASRLEGANKIYGSRILIAESTAEIVRGKFILRKLDVLRVKGKAQPMAVYELLGERGAAEDVTGLIAPYEIAFELYQNQKWAEAHAHLLEVLKHFPDDSPSKALLKRVGSLQASPPLAQWDGVYDAKEK